MNNFLDQLNLSPGERRTVVIIGVVVIVVLNFLFVWPHFGEWGKIRTDLDNMRADIQKYNRQIALDTSPNNGLQQQLAKLVHQEGTGVMDNQIQLQNTIATQARRTGVDVSTYNPGAANQQTNEFFEKEAIKITVDSQEPNLVNFLYNIGGDPAMIRVSELELSPQDQNRYRLRGAITLTANYNKRAPAPGSSAAGKIPGAPKPKGVPGAITAAKTPLGGGPQKPFLGAPGAGAPANRGLPGQNQPVLPGQRALPNQHGPPGLNPIQRNPFSRTNKVNGQ
jgi:hypothetical protein